MACFLCFTGVFGTMDNQLTLGNPFSSLPSPFQSSFPTDFPSSTTNSNWFIPLSYQSYLSSSTTNNNNSSQSVPSFLKKKKRKRDDRELIPATTGTNKEGNLAYECALCGCFLSRMKRTAYSCNMCRKCFTVDVRDGQTYLVMSKESSSKKYRLKNCECSECLSHDVYFVGNARYGTVRCICGNCGNGGLCLPSKNPETNARLIGWNELKQHTKGNPISKLALYKLRDRTK
jgi:hypothetical protein